VIPLIAVVFTGASWAGGRNLRHATQIVHSTVLSTGVTGSDAMTYLGVSSRSGGRLRIGWPAGWLTGASDGSVQTIVPDNVRLTPAGPEARIPLDANQFAVVSGQGPLAGATGALEITAGAIDDGQVRGVIRNGTKLRLDRTAVFLGTAGTETGALGPGESRPWALRVDQALGGPPPEALVLGRGGNADSLTDFALWTVAARSGRADRPPGQALAVGWTTEYKPAVRVGGTTAHPDGRTMVLGTAPVSATGPRAADVAFAREVVRTTRGVASVYRFTVPSGNLAGDRTVELSKLMVRSPTFPLEVWTGEAWTQVSCGSCVGAGKANIGGTAVACSSSGPCVTVPVPIQVGPVGAFFEARVPAEAVRDGSIYVRFPQGAGSFSSDTTFSVREMA